MLLIILIPFLYTLNALCIVYEYCVSMGVSNVMTWLSDKNFRIIFLHDNWLESINSNNGFLTNMLCDLHPFRYMILLIDVAWSLVDEFTWITFFYSKKEEDFFEMLGKTKTIERGSGSMAMVHNWSGLVDWYPCDHRPLLILLVIIPNGSPQILLVHWISISVPTST